MHPCSEQQGRLTRSFQSHDHSQNRYAPYKSFQSHKAEFDYLKSLEIEEKINQIRWCRPSNDALYLLSTNDKTIKLWRLHNREVRTVQQFQHPANTYGDVIRLPTLNKAPPVAVATTKKVFANAHTYHINSIALNSDGETFISADDLRINLWHLGVSDQSFSTFHPHLTSLTIVVWTVISCYNYLTLKIWDINMESRPVHTINIHEHLRPRLCELYDTDCIFDKFECSVSGDGNNFVTGSYNSEFHIYDRYGRSDYCLNPLSNAGRRRSSAPHTAISRALATGTADGDPLDFTSKVLQTTWHPTTNEVAVAIKNNVYLYSAKQDAHPNKTITTPPSTTSKPNVLVTQPTESRITASEK
ncbi:hypothetical protein DYB28_000163 [Aphanomyces astaci]|uniref:Serine/threonine-protein phosphatase 2A 55 kDa regulatory subunit B n=1 Tax=Aphanomyces astaci TaxID=112090 RepID=A0A9X8E568_APHAT|nr:hypothetical protein DYB28_000163 [Aphanomyces astaci]